MEVFPRKSALLLLLLCLLSGIFLLERPADAAKPNIYGEHWQCIRAINYYEKKYNLPKNLLYAISIVESGYNRKGGFEAMPWPWTINALGKSHYLSNKNAALHLLRQLIAQGHTNIDVGCAQINWANHKKHFGDKPENILNPIYNTAYAAHYLTNGYLARRSWPKAVGQYHSATPHLAQAYISRVYKKLQRLQDRVIVALDNNPNPHDKLLYKAQIRTTNNAAKMRSAIAGSGAGKQQELVRSTTKTKSRQQRGKSISQPMLIAKAKTKAAVGAKVVAVIPNN